MYKLSIEEELYRGKNDRVVPKVALFFPYFQEVLCTIHCYIKSSHMQSGLFWFFKSLSMGQELGHT